MRDPVADPLGHARQQIQELEQRRREKPDDSRTLYELGMAYKSLLRFVDAEECFRAVLARETKDTWSAVSRLELDREPERAASERRALASGGARWALHRARRWLVTSPVGRKVRLLVFLVPLSIGIWVLLRDAIGSLK